MLNLAAIHEAIAQAVPDRECLVAGGRRSSFREVSQRTRRLAALLGGAGLGCRAERAGLAGWESGQDHVALYLVNGHEYLEGMLGAFKARAVPVNVNYRYTDEELVRLLLDADARAVIFHARFAGNLARIRGRLPGVRLWLQVQDGSGAPLLPDALDYETALEDAEPAPPRGLSEDDLYILYTGGTTGPPRGVLWRQADIFRAALYPARARSITLKAIAERARDGPNSGIRCLPAPPFMHGAAHWVAFSMWHSGGTVIVPPEPERFDPHRLWSAVERERVDALSIVGDAFGRPLLEQLGRRRYDLSSLRLLTSGGAILSGPVKQGLLAHLPALRIVDSLGASESGIQASRVSAAGRRSRGDGFAPGADCVVLSDDRREVLAPGGGEGWLARRGPVPLGYYRDPERTARSFPGIHGTRYAVPGDRARLDADGVLHLLGRDAATINSGGEKVFAEEVEQALVRHPRVRDAVVVGTPHERFGQVVTAVVCWDGEGAPSEEELRLSLAPQLASFKLPRRIVAVEQVERQPSGKADYRWARRVAMERLGLVDRRRGSAL